MGAEELRGHGMVMFENPRIIKDFNLVDQNGSEFGLEKLKGKLSFVFFGFTHCPDVCPTTLSELSRVYAKLDANAQQHVQMILVSLDPARDTPEQLKPYIEYFDPSFTALTGAFPNIMSLTNNVNVAFSKVKLDEDYTIDHTSHVVIINEFGHYAGFVKAPLPTVHLPRIIESTLIPAMDL